MGIYEFEGVRPVVDPSAYVHPEASLIGDVWIGPEAYIAPHASLRGDYGRLIVEAKANVQDCCVLHGYSNVDTIVGYGSSIGHGAILHGCRIGKFCLVGMHSVVLDGSTIGDESIVAAMSLVTSGYRGNSGELLKGIPARATRLVTKSEKEWHRFNQKEYSDLSARAARSLKPCQPLTSDSWDRPYLAGYTEVKPIHGPGRKTE